MSETQEAVSTAVTTLKERAGSPLTTDEVQSLASEEIFAEAHHLKIVDQPSFDLADSLRTRIAEGRKLVASKFDPLQKAAMLVHRGLKSFRDEIEARIVEADSVLREKMRLHILEERALRQKEQEEQRAIIQKQMEDRRLAIAEQAEIRGEAEVAEAIVSAPMPVAPPISTRPATPAGADTKVTEIWRWRYVDADVDSPGQGVLPAFMIPDIKRIDAVVKQMGTKAVAIVGGIEVYKDVQVGRKGTRR